MAALGEERSDSVGVVNLKPVTRSLHSRKPSNSSRRTYPNSNKMSDLDHFFSSLTRDPKEEPSKNENIEAITVPNMNPRIVSANRTLSGGMAPKVM